jgi:hypothetical protein
VTEPGERVVLDQRRLLFGSSALILVPIFLFCGIVALASWLIKGTIGGTIAAAAIFGVFLLICVANVGRSPYRIAIIGDELEIRRYLGGRKRRPLAQLEARVIPRQISPATGGSVSYGKYKVIGPGLRFTLGSGHDAEREQIVEAIKAARS